MTHKHPLSVRQQQKESRGHTGAHEGQREWGGGCDRTRSETNRPKHHMQCEGCWVSSSFSHQGGAAKQGGSRAGENVGAWGGKGGGREPRRAERGGRVSYLTHQTSAPFPYYLIFLISGSQLLCPSTLMIKYKILHGPFNLVTYTLK